jgi:hypothetical protein
MRNLVPKSVEDSEIESYFNTHQLFKVYDLGQGYIRNDSDNMHANTIKNTFAKNKQDDDLDFEFSEQKFSLKERAKPGFGMVSMYSDIKFEEKDDLVSVQNV